MIDLLKLPIKKYFEKILLLMKKNYETCFLYTSMLDKLLTCIKFSLRKLNIVTARSDTISKES